MKKLIITLVAVFAMAFSAKAQFYVSGSIGVNLMASNGLTGSSWNIDPGVGYAFTDKSSAGLYLSLGGSDSAFAWSLNPYYRYIFASVKDFHFFAEADVSLGQLAKSFSWGVGLVPGISYSFNDKFSITGHIGYLGGEGVGDSAAFRFNLLSSSRFGIEYKF